MSTSARRVKIAPRYSKPLPDSPTRHRPRTLRLCISARSCRQLVLACLALSAILSILLAFSPLKHFRHRRKVSIPAPHRTPTRYRGRVPILDREKYEEVEARMQYYIDIEGRDPNFEDWTVPPNPLSPPKVTTVPEMPTRSKTKAVELWPNEKADSQLCPASSGCRFLLPAW